MFDKLFDAQEIIDEYLNLYQTDNSLTDEDMERLRTPEQLNRILPRYLLGDIGYYERFIRLVIEKISHLLGEKITPKKMTQTHTHSFESLAYQEIRGAHRIIFSLTGQCGALLPIANKFADKEFRRMNGEAFDSVCEFINTLCGAYASMMSDENIVYEIMPPAALSRNTIQSDDVLYVLPIEACGKEISMVFAFNTDVNLECGAKEDDISANILIVDDSVVTRNSMRKILEYAGHNVVGEAVDGDDAVEKYLSLRPDIITMDVTMPKKGGLKALKEIISHDPDAVVLMVSASAQKGTISEALIHGAYDFIRKPFEPDEVLDKISEALTFFC